MSKIKERMNYTLITILTTLCISTTLQPCTRYVESQYPDPMIAELVEKNIDRIMNLEESSLNITFDSKPKVEFVFPEEFLILAFAGKTGFYTPTDKTIHLASKFLTTQEFGLKDVIKYLSFGITKTRYDTLLAHELGHHYVSQESEKLDESKSFKIGEIYDSRITALKIIHEGIGEYFSSMISPIEDSFNDEEWPKTLEGFLEPHIQYKGGFHLVKPIIDKHKSKGIKYLINNPPSKFELFDLPNYQKKALEELDRIPFCI
ncbi:hypothetical protein HN662_03420 [Candidatus Woesearchaeota archaeon]|jgi:hypothetical protein|nr:hypothetical protein [Candidatus Woesearchaeota archaeon]